MGRGVEGPREPRPPLGAPGGGEDPGVGVVPPSPHAPSGRVRAPPSPSPQPPRGAFTPPPAPAVGFGEKRTKIRKKPTREGRGGPKIPPLLPPPNKPSGSFSCRRLFPVGPGGQILGRGWDVTSGGWRGRAGGVTGGPGGGDTGTPRRGASNGGGSEGGQKGGAGGGDGGGHTRVPSRSHVCPSTPPFPRSDLPHSPPWLPRAPGEGPRASPAPFVQTPPPPRANPAPRSLPARPPRRQGARPSSTSRYFRPVLCD